jgi:drug/metabolite transporter (DMT)-like permease
MTTSKAISGAAFATLLLIALMMGANHVAARLAFNNGVDVATAVVFRSVITAAVLAVLIAVQGVALRFSPRHKRMLPVIGLLIGVQSLCLYSAVARLPVALALLAFNTYPIWAALWSAIVYRKPPERPLLLAMPVILVGLALALDVFGATSGLGASDQWARIGAGVAFALAAAATFALAMPPTSPPGSARPPPWRWPAWSRWPRSPPRAASTCPRRPPAGAGWWRSRFFTARPSPSCSPCCRAWAWSATPPS